MFLPFPFEIVFVSGSLTLKSYVAQSHQGDSLVIPDSSCGCCQSQYV